MNIEELENKHHLIFENRLIRNPNIKHTKLSIQFAIEVLEEIDSKKLGLLQNLYLQDKIQELKQYLDEKV